MAYHSSYFMSITLVGFKLRTSMFPFFFFFNDTATTEIYTLSLHDALPISTVPSSLWITTDAPCASIPPISRSEEHTSELQSRPHLVCRLLLEKKKKNYRTTILYTKKIYNHLGHIANQNHTQCVTVFPRVQL